MGEPPFSSYPTPGQPHPQQYSPGLPQHSTESAHQLPLQQQQQQDEGDSPGQVKPLRAMLARGAACDTCRARKVKCDATRPFCSPCLKSARGNESIAASKCAYEGTSVAIATANRQAEIEKNGGVKRKRRMTKAMKEAASNGSSAAGGGSANGEEGEGEVSPQQKRTKRTKQESFGEERDSRASSRSLADEEGFSQPQDPSRQLPAPPPLAPYQSSSIDGYNRTQPPSQLPLPPPPSLAPSWPQGRPYEPLSHPSQRFPLPPYSSGERYPGRPESGMENGTREVELSNERAPVPGSRQAPPPPLANHSNYATYGSPAQGARSPSFPYHSNYSSHAPLPSASSYSTYNNNGPPANPPYPFSNAPAPQGNSLSYSTSSNGSNAPSQYPPIQLAPPSGINSSSSQYGPPAGSSLPPHLASQNLPIDSRRRSLSALSAIAVGLEEYPPGSASNSPTPGGLNGWPHHHQQHGEGGYRFTTASPVSSTRHLGMSEPQAFALTASPGGRNWNTTTSSLRTEMTNYDPVPAPLLPPRGNEQNQDPASQPFMPQRDPTPPTTASIHDSSSQHTASNSTSPSTLPPSGETGPEDPKIPMSSSKQNPMYQYEPLDLGTSMFPLLDLAYPASLPPLSVLHHLVSTFFKRAAVPSTMLSKSKLLFALSLSPTDPRWPEETLLHAICAYACMFVSEESLGGGDYGGLGLNGWEAGGGGLGGMRMRYWEVEGDATARDYHYKKAKEAIEEALSLTKGKRAGRNLFQVLQAVILVCYTAYLSAYFSDLWLLAGIATRLIAPLGLNHLEPWDFNRGRSGPAYQDWGSRVRKAERTEILGGVKDLAEHWERSTTFWLAFAVDRFASANTDWTTSIDEKDISTHLPCTATMPMPCLSIDPQLGYIATLNLTSPTFLEDTSAPIGSLGLYIKATILLGRVVNYTQRFPRYLVIPEGESCSKIKRTIKASPEFIELDVAISKFKASHSANFFDAAGTTVDGFLASAYTIPHVATILLHETLTDRYDRSPSSSIQRCLSAAKCIINSTYILYQSSYDLGGVDPFLPFCWSVAGRALVRDYTTRLYWGQQDEAGQARQLAEHCLGFTQHCAKSGSRIAQRLTETLEQHLANPESLLPLDEGCNVLFSLDDPVAAEAWGMSEEDRQRELKTRL